MKRGDLIRSSARTFTNFEGKAGERISVNVFPHLSQSPSIGVFHPYQLGIILETSLVDVKIFIPESGLIGWVSGGFLEVVSETR